MTPTKLLLASAVSLAVLLAGCAGNEDQATGQYPGDENADLYGDDAAPQPGENIPGNATPTGTGTTGDADTGEATTTGS